MSDPVKAAAISSADELMRNIAPNTEGAGAGWLPEDGDHACFCIGFTEEVADFRSSTEPPISGMQYVFHFKRLPTPQNRLEKPEPFSGTRMNIPNTAPTSEKGQTKFRMDAERLVGHMKTLLGPEFTDSLETNKKKLRAKLETMKAIPVLVRVTTSPGKGGGSGFRKEILAKNLEKSQAPESA